MLSKAHVKMTLSALFSQRTGALWNPCVGKKALDLWNKREIKLVHFEKCTTASCQSRRSKSKKERARTLGSTLLRCKSAKWSFLHGGKQQPEKQQPLKSGECEKICLLYYRVDQHAHTRHDDAPIKVMRSGRMSCLGCIEKWNNKTRIMFISDKQIFCLAQNHCRSANNLSAARESVGQSKQRTCKRSSCSSSWTTVTSSNYYY